MAHLRRLLKHFGWITVALGGLWVVRTLVPEAWLRGANDVGGSFLQTFGGMYGVIVAFAIYVVWQQHNDTQTAIEREAVALVELWTLLRYFGFDERHGIRDKLLEYAAVVPRLNRVNPAHCQHDEKTLLTQCMHEFLAKAAPADERLFEPCLDLFHELNEAREHRLTVSRLRLGEGMRAFVVIGAVIVVGALCLLHIDALALHAVFVAGMTWVVVASASIVFDLDDPYTGDFVVNWTRFEEAAHTMRAEAGAMDPGAVRPLADPPHTPGKSHGISAS